MTRTAWPDLPAAVHRAIAARTGPIARARDIPHGLTCHAAALLETSGGALFVKGVRRDDGEGLAAQRWEVAVSHLVTDTAPRLRWHVTAAGWDMLVFDYVPGRHADLTPGSPDLPLIARALHQAPRQVAPGAAPDYAHRWTAWLDPSELRPLRGEQLLHTDTNPHNILITAHRAHLIDWAMPARGPAWIDAAYTAIRLMEDGHTADAAVAWAQQIPAWHTATPAALHAWVAAHCRQWRDWLGPLDAAPGIARWQGLLQAATRRQVIHH